MQLENLVVDALDPARLGRWWEEAVGGRRLTDEPGIYETRSSVDGGPWLDLCFQRVPAVPPADGATTRLRPVLAAPGRARGAATDPEGNPLEAREAGTDDATGPLASLLLASADPRRDVEFWAWLTGWRRWGDPGTGGGTTSLRHPSGRGPLLELVPEPAPEGRAKNRMHLDVRLEPGEDADDAEAGIRERGGARLDVDWGDLPWRSYTDPSGNELCVLRASAG